MTLRLQLLDTNHFQAATPSTGYVAFAVRCQGGKTRSMRTAHHSAELETLWPGSSHNAVRVALKLSSEASASSQAGRRLT
jgi:hypothetical protein